MIFLDKSQQAAIDYVDSFLTKNWIDQGEGIFKYINITYSSIKNPVKDFKDFFVGEQGDKCCYCCRNISSDHNTELEHIIPRSLSTAAEFNQYYANSEILKRNVVPQSVFNETEKFIKTPPFPHHIAYQNIVASCHGRTFSNSEDFTCCNRNRGDEFIPPFNLMNECIAYMPDGSIVYLKDIENRKYFDILNLNKKVLNNIRRLWYLFSRSELNINEILDDNFTDSISEKIVAYAMSQSSTILEDNILNETFSIPDNWKAFKSYSYFFDYYKR